MKKIFGFLLVLGIIFTVTGCSDNKNDEIIIPETTETTTANTTQTTAVEVGYFVDLDDNELKKLGAKEFEETLIALSYFYNLSFPLTFSDTIEENGLKYTRVSPDFAQNKNGIETYLLRYVTTEFKDIILTPDILALFIEKDEKLYFQNVQSLQRTVTSIYKGYEIIDVIDVTENSVSYEIAYIYTNNEEEEVKNYPFEIVAVDSLILANSVVNPYYTDLE